MNQLPINKIFIAGFAFAITHWKKILEISIFPVVISLPLFSILPELLALMEQALSGGLTLDLVLPDNTTLYLILFLYGHISLSINLYRLVVLGEQSASTLPVLDASKIIRFIGLMLLVGIVSAMPILFTNLLILQFVASFLVVPITLNFINIAIGRPSKYRWGLSFSTHMSLFFLQVVVPMLIILLFTSLSSIIGLGAGVALAAKALAFYWGSITLALCYQLITATNDSTKTL
ncbi:MAG: hypothetical protein PSN36_03890 [Gammaproteobacteria bacterium]|nr:hypothetical protein [Gammaproteobacteria bacterium]